MLCIKHKKNKKTRYKDNIEVKNKAKRKFKWDLESLGDQKHVYMVHEDNCLLTSLIFGNKR